MNNQAYERAMAVLADYEETFTLLDNYDHQCLTVDQQKILAVASKVAALHRGVMRSDTFESMCAHNASSAVASLQYDECRAIIEGMRFSDESELFGVEKDDSFQGVLNSLDQTFMGVELYPTLLHKASALYYSLVKDHPFLDGCKRIAAALFLIYLDRNHALYTKENKKIIASVDMAALTIAVASSDAQDRDKVLALIAWFITR